MRPAVRAELFSLPLAVSLGVAFLVWRGQTSPWLAVLWFLSLFPFALATRDRPRGGQPRPLRPSTIGLLLFAAALPVLVRFANMDPARMHTDEFITAYASAKHDFAHTSFFGSIPEYWEWQGQFPKPFFFLQRVFFAFFGASTLTLRLSVQIYVALVSVMLFLIVREILNWKAALVAVVLNSFFAVSVYMETLGFMFISSTAIFTVFFYFALREYRTGETFYAALAGIACGFCFLTYYSSYLALPMLVAFSAVRWLRERRLQVVRNFVVALFGMLVVTAPFLAFMIRSGNYVAPRTKQVALLTGEWSRYREAIAAGTRKPLSVIMENLTLSLKSFVQNDIGGHGGYDLGHLAFFDRFSLVLFLAGFLTGLVLAFRKTELIFVFLAIGAPFLTGMVLTIPPPAYHRFCIAFPFLVILMTLPFDLLLRVPRVPGSVRYALVAGLLLLYASTNERYFVEAVIRDPPPDELRLAELINRRFDGRKLYVAAFDAFAFQKILYFVDKWPDRRVETTFHDHLLKRFNTREKYVYVIILADAFKERFRKADPNGRWFHFSPNYSLFAN
jgi:4-amino-4-deoxy-L-arabinose transferase-like glycosyltransferase